MYLAAMLEAFCPVGFGEALEINQGIGPLTSRVQYLSYGYEEEDLRQAARLPGVTYMLPSGQ